MASTRWTIIVGMILVLGTGATTVAADIHKAAKDGELSDVRSILDADPAAVNAVDEQGFVPLHHAAARGHADVVALLIERGAVVRVSDPRGRTPLHFAAAGGHLAAAELLIDHGAVVSARAVGAATPLHWAAFQGRVDMAELLLSRGVVLEAKCNAEITALYWAAYYDHEDLLRLLLSHGAEMDYRDLLGRTPLQVATVRGLGGIIEILLGAGADARVREMDSGRTLLHLAALHGHGAVARALMDSGVPVDEVDADGHTALDLATRHGHRALADTLVGRGASGRPASSVCDPFSRESLDDGDAYFLKLREGSWAVKTRDHLLLFCYSESGSRADEPSFASGYVTAAGLRGYRTAHFDHTFHPQPEYRFVYLLEKEGAKITYFLGEDDRTFYEGKGLNGGVYLGPREVWSDEGMEVRVVPAHGRQRGFYIRTDGVALLWIPAISDAYNASDRFTEGIDGVAAEGLPVDILLLGVPDGLGTEVEVALRDLHTTTASLGATILCPMGDEALCHSFAAWVGTGSDGVGVLCADSPGTGFLHRRIR